MLIQLPLEMNVPKFLIEKCIHTIEIEILFV